MALLDPLQSPVPPADPRPLVRQMLSAQETALALVAAPIFLAAEEATAAQEESLLSVVRELRMDAQRRVAEQRRMLASVADDLARLARTRVNTQSALLASAEGGNEDGPSTQAEPEPPGSDGDWYLSTYTAPGSDGRCWIAHTTIAPPVLPPPLEWEATVGTWTTRAAAEAWATETYGPSDSCAAPPPPSEEWQYTFWRYDEAVEQWCWFVHRTSEPGQGAVPEGGHWGGTIGIYPTQAAAVAAATEAHGAGDYCGEPPIPGVPPPIPPTPPPGEPPPGEPPPPPTTPPPDQPPRDEPPVYVPPPPPAVDCPPSDPCFPRGLTLVERVVYTATPRPLPFWVRARCVGICQAEIECYTGDCPPAHQDGWLDFGPYYACPNQQEREAIVRRCVGGGGTEPPSEPPIPPIEIPDYVQPPPPLPPREPPPREPPPESCGFQTHEPRWQAVTPYCGDEATWLSEIFSGVKGTSGIGNVQDALVEAYDDDLADDPMAEYLGREE